MIIPLIKQQTKQNYVYTCTVDTNTTKCLPTDINVEQL